MGLARQIKPISYLKANAAEIIRTLPEMGEPMIITQHGEAKAVLQDIASYERTQETLALLRLIAIGKKQVEAGQVRPAKEVLARIRAKHKLR